MRIENSIDIDAPIERVWALTIDVESWPKHTPTITAVERLDTGPLHVGSTARIEQPGQRPRTWTVTELEEPRRFSWSARAMGTTMTASHELRTGEGRTTNRLVVEIEGAPAPIVGALLRRPIGKAIATENDGFKAAAETG